MSLHTIKNLLAKFSNKEINILYFPAMSAIDMSILDIPVNYFGNTSIKHKNLTNISELTWLNYDFIFTHYIDNNIVNLSNIFHIPILYYINTRDKIKDDAPKNTIFLYDTPDKTTVQNGICINLINTNDNVLDTNKTNDALVINYHHQTINENLRKNLTQNIQDITIIDSLPQSLHDLETIFASHKVCIDFTPANIHDAILAIKNKCIYINFINENVNIDHKYDNLHNINHLDYNIYNNLIALYNTNQFHNDLKDINNQKNTNSASDLASVYNLLKYRRYVI